MWQTPVCVTAVNLYSLRMGITQKAIIRLSIQSKQLLWWQVLFKHPQIVSLAYTTGGLPNTELNLLIIFRCMLLFVYTADNEWVFFTFERTDFRTELHVYMYVLIHIWYNSLLRPVVIPVLNSRLPMWRRYRTDQIG